MSNLYGVPMELLYASTAVGTAVADTATETALNDSTGMGAAPVLPANYFANGRVGRALRIVARGIVSTPSSSVPTLTLRLRSGAATIQATPSGGVNILGSAAIAEGASLASAFFEFEGDIVLTALGTTSGSSTVRGLGLMTGAALPTPFSAALYAGSATPGSVATFDTTTAQTLVLSAQWATAVASTSITLQQFLVYGQN